MSLQEQLLVMADEERRASTGDNKRAGEEGDDAAAKRPKVAISLSKPAVRDARPGSR